MRALLTAAVGAAPVEDDLPLAVGVSAPDRVEAAELFSVRSEHRSRAQAQRSRVEHGYSFGFPRERRFFAFEKRSPRIRYGFLSTDLAVTSEENRFIGQKGCECSVVPVSHRFGEGRFRGAQFILQFGYRG